DVVPAGGTELRCWARRPGGPLLLEAKNAWKAGQIVTAQVVLGMTAPTALGRQPRPWKLPHLVPMIPGKFAGSYAVTFARHGGLAAPSVVVSQAPGHVAFTAGDRTAG